MGTARAIRHDYAVFLSYAREDERIARQLRGSLEKYRLPRGAAKVATDDRRNLLCPVFCDIEEAASGQLNEQLQDALQASRALIVVCSPHAAVSQWVDAEIRYFEKLGKHDRIFAYIVDGEPNAVEPNTLACFPAAFRTDENHLTKEGVPQQVLAADARRGRDGPHRAFLRLVAGILKLDLASSKKILD